MYEPVEQTCIASNTFIGKRQCKNCKFYHKWNRKEGECRKFEYMIATNTKNNHVKIIYQQVKPYYVCENWKQ